MHEVLVKNEEFKNSPLGNIPKDWELIKIGYSTNIENGTTPSREEDKFWTQGTIPWLTTGKVHDRIIYEADEFITEYALRLCSLRILPVETVLVAMIGQGLTRGKVAYLASQATINQNFGAILPCSSFDSKYLFHYLDFNYEYVRGSSQGSNQQALNCAVIAQLMVLRPPLEEQRHIAEILDTVDEAIARTSSLITKLKQTKAGLVQDLLTRGLDEDGKLRDPQVHPELFKDSPLGRIPKEWEVAKIGEACSLVKDGSHLPPKRVENGPLLLSVQNMINGRFQLTACDTRISWDFYKTMHKNWQIQVGDVLLAIVGATIGKTAVVPPMSPFTLQRSVAVLRGKLDTLENSFLHLYISNDKFQRLIWHKVNQTAQPGIYLAELASFYIPLPSLKEQKNITTVIESQNTRIRTEEAYLNKLNLQKQGLMQDLLTGKVRVKNIK